ncbi:MAG: M23 family peptidase [Proteobacteria bacterium]|nr:M23 family peptidase [Pseudomonadota bacterium]
MKVLDGRLTAPRQGDHPALRFVGSSSSSRPNDAAVLRPSLQQPSGFPLLHLRLGSVHASSLQNRQTTSLLLTGLLVFGIGTTGHHYLPSLSGTATNFVSMATPVVEELVDSAPVQAVTETAAEVQEMAEAAVAPKPEAVTRVVELDQGRTFMRLLMDAAIPSDEAVAASDALTKIYDHRKLKAGQEVTLNITRTGEQYSLTSLTFEPNSTQEISIARAVDGSYKGELKNTPIERKRIAVRGEIRNSLYAAGEREGVPRAIMASIIRAYAHEIDFQRDIHRGDKFEVLYDQPTARNGNPVGQGVIIYAALIIDGKPRPLYRVTFGDGAVDYFNEKGQSVKRSLLRTPLESARVTSSFGMRRHPLLGYSKMHKGVDFGAPTGTPIYAAGSGVIKMAQWHGGYGRFVKIQHNGRTATAYGHMSRIARGIAPGTRVKQGDVIGFVGNTGRSTGPHLHYEVVVDNKQVNPLTVSMPTGRTLSGKTLAQFKNGQSKIRGEFSTLLKQREEQRQAKGPSPIDEKDDAPTNS